MNYGMKVAEQIEFEGNSLYEALLKGRDKRKVRGNGRGWQRYLVLGLLPVRGFTAIAARRRVNAWPAEALALVLYAFI